MLHEECLRLGSRPPVFVMENVKGLLLTQVDGEPVIDKMVKDLSKPIWAIKRNNNGLKYQLHSLSCSGEIRESIDLKSFIVKAGKYGVPQARQRMFILGIRLDIGIQPDILKKRKPRLQTQ